MRTVAVAPRRQPLGKAIAGGRPLNVSPNPLFAEDSTSMLVSDAKRSMHEVGNTYKKSTT